MAAILVIIPGLPLADLHAWGRDPDAVGWGLACWPGPDHMRPAFRSAWVPAHRLQRSPGAAQRSAPATLGLPADRARWPLLWTADGVRVDHLGAIANPEFLEQAKRPG